MAQTERVLSALVLGTLIACVIVVSLNNGESTPSQTARVVDTEDYTLAGFKVVKFYKCIFPTCTDFWCNANCNHKPRYCPKSFCREHTRMVPVPTPPPTSQPTVQPTDEPTDQPEPDVTAVPTDSPTFSPTNVPTNRPTPSPTCEKTSAWDDMIAKNNGAQHYGKDACHPIICLGIKKAWKRISEKERTQSPVQPDQCTNCFCFGCSDSQFAKKCGGVRPTEPACTNPGCCPADCLGHLGNVLPKNCANPECADCAAGLFGYNCKTQDDGSFVAKGHYSYEGVWIPN